MQIHVIRSGETLTKIAQAYGLSVQEIAETNEVPDRNRLVVGQTLVIPTYGEYHWVQPGESLWLISRRYNVTVEELVRINNIQNPNNIPIGLRLYLPQKPKRVVETNAYIDPRMTRGRSAAAVDKVGEHLTYLAIFSYAVNRNGELTPVEDQPSLNAAFNDRVLPLLVLTNFEEGQFSTEIATAILTNEALQDRVLNQVLQIMEEKGYRGLDFDFEYLGAENRERYVRFLQKARQLLKPRGYYLSAALAPKYRAGQRGVLYEGHDYQAIGQVVDFIFFMTYEWGWSGGRPMAVSPLPQMRQVMEYAVSVVPREKIMLGMPLYGYDWTLPYVEGGKFAKSFSPQRALELAIRYGVSINYDQTSQAPWFRYTDEQGNQHEVWFEDARSMQAKFDLVKELGIRGFYYWVLGNDFPQNWLLIEDNFVVRKLI
ncbi:glycosyl hydrolase family 18 protein [Desulfosporosinus sp.]|uniref:glycosyl hydrolase family 18 protein n=1 Tax=Desulfosporosinus sp. TaxID=157907 RepID=UPI0025BF4304|nr:glycosyl hydrolase family 18 protein [Desulfosporosinus sp.]MBC2722749.1 LysM peptidoglycan-binding domain-containing protein [Desulfosporosinus sp.]MBC2724924.1 LysM peptidoglycan-binding domain-containing protein [Desulfosporosinus sp.]